jgi:isopentenyldiphosphate isomerase
MLWHNVKHCRAIFPARSAFSAATFSRQVKLLLQEPIHAKQSWSVLVVMTEVCGHPDGSPPGSWEMGNWATVAENRDQVASRFAAAMNDLAGKTTDERLAKEARGRARSITRRPAGR